MAQSSLTFTRSARLGASAASVAAEANSGWSGWYWTCQLGGWGLYFLLTFSLLSQLPRVSLQSLFPLLLLQTCLFLGFSHFLRYLIKRHHWLALDAGALIGRVLGMCVALGVVLCALSYLFNSLVLHGPTNISSGGASIPFALRFVLSALNAIVMFIFWAALYCGAALLRQRQQAEVHQLKLAQALQGAELRLLKSQLNPHFLFNSLNSVRALISDDPSRAQSAVTQLARTLRYTLSSGLDDIVSLERELEIVDDYLDLEALRLGPRLQVARNIEDAARASRIPIMLLQTLIENAIKHGIAELPQGGLLQYSAAVEDNVLVLTVENPRPPRASLTMQRGVGLTNASERLRLLCGTGASLTLDVSQPYAAIAHVRVPQTL